MQQLFSDLKSKLQRLDQQSANIEPSLLKIDQDIDQKSLQINELKSKHAQLEIEKAQLLEYKASNEKERVAVIKEIEDIYKEARALLKGNASQTISDTQSEDNQKIAEAQQEKVINKQRLNPEVKNEQLRNDQLDWRDPTAAFNYYDIIEIFDDPPIVEQCIIPDISLSQGIEFSQNDKNETISSSLPFLNQAMRQRSLEKQSETIFNRLQQMVRDMKEKPYTYQYKINGPFDVYKMLYFDDEKILDPKLNAKAINNRLYERYLKLAKPDKLPFQNAYFRYRDKYIQQQRPSSPMPLIRPSSPVQLQNKKPALQFLSQHHATLTPQKLIEDKSQIEEDIDEDSECINSEAPLPPIDFRSFCQKNKIRDKYGRPFSQLIPSYQAKIKEDYKQYLKEKAEEKRTYEETLGVVSPNQGQIGKKRVQKSKTLTQFFLGQGPRFSHSQIQSVQMSGKRAKFDKQ